MKAVQAMTRNVICVGERESLQTALELMKEWDIRHLPVTDNGKLVGIISDRDITPYASAIGELEWRRGVVGDVMTKNVISASPVDPISHIANVMSLHKIDCLPVVEDDGSERLVGLITSMDLVDLLREKEILDVSRTVPWSYKVELHQSESPRDIY